MHECSEAFFSRMVIEVSMAALTDNGPHSKLERNLVMGGTENLLSQLLKDKIPRYQGILPYSDFYMLINILQRNLHFI